MNPARLLSPRTRAVIVRDPGGAIAEVWASPDRRSAQRRRTQLVSELGISRSRIEVWRAPRKEVLL